MLTEILQQEKMQLEKQIKELKKNINSFPEGKLLCEENGKYFKWYKSNGYHPIYIPKKERKTAELLAVKQYYIEQMKSLEQQLSFINQNLTTLLESESKYLSMLLETSPFHNLLVTYFKANSPQVTAWLQEEYEHNSFHSENLLHQTLSGELVRSKSEVIIANALFLHHIPYRYECKLELGSLSLYPDFTIYHSKTNKFFYWEHFGMMDREKYRDEAITKLRTYTSYNIIPSIDLITTYETLSNPINSAKINKIIEEYFK